MKFRVRRVVAAMAAVATFATVGLAAGTAVASTVPTTSVVQTTAHRNVVYYAEGTIRPVNQKHFCLTYQIAETEGSRVFWYPCTTVHGKPLSLQMWYTEKVLGVGSISEWGYPWVLGKSHNNRDLYARVWKLAEKPKMKFYTTVHIIFHEHLGWQVWMKIGPKVFVLSVPRKMDEKKAKVHAYYATFTNGSDLKKRDWNLYFDPGFKVMDQ